MDNLGAMSSNYTDFLGNSQIAQARMQNIKSSTTESASDTEMMNACKQFEEYLIEMVMKEVTKNMDILGTGQASSAAMASSNDLLKDKMVQQMATIVSDEGGLGIAQKLYESMKVRENTIPASELVDRKEE